MKESISSAAGYSVTVYGTGFRLRWDILRFSFSLGIAARNAGLTPMQGLLGQPF